MRDNFINEFLIDPISRDPLIFDSSSYTYLNPLSGKSYPVVESVPRIIIDEATSFSETDFHKLNNSKFNYKDHYQKDAELFDYSKKDLPEVTRNENLRLRESIIKEITNNLTTVLDVGCGNGWVSNKLIPRGKRVISMDISSANPINAVQEVPHKNHCGLIADVFNIPLKENTIDCIIASEILEHVPNPSLFILNLLMVLKPSGKLIITTPYNEKIEYCLCVHCNKPTPRFAHLNSFNEKNIMQFIPREGCTVVISKFLNRYLSRIKSYILLKNLPFDIWYLIDNLFNKILNKPTRLQIVITKDF